MTDFVEQLISDATQSDADTLEATVPTPAEVETDESSSADGEPANKAAPEVDVPFPKKAINAISRRDKQIGKLRAEAAQAQSELAKYRQQYEPGTQSQQGQKPAPNEPKEDSFDNYGDYLKAVARHEARQELAKENTNTQQAQMTAQQQQWVAQREEVVENQAIELIQANPELRDLVIEHADVLDDFPPHLQMAFLESDNAALAFVALAKEGKLESLMSMSPARAAMEIGRAIDRGSAMMKAKKITTTAPAPMTPVKGAGPAGKQIDSTSSPDDLMKWLNTK